MSIIICCKDCVAPKRYPGCHSQCPEYIAQKAEHERLKEAENKQKQTSYGITIERTNAVKKALKGRRGGFRSNNSKRGRD